jgi:hypothetical protein
MMDNIGMNMMSSGMIIWDIVGILLIILLIVVIFKLLKK